MKKPPDWIDLWAAFYWMQETGHGASRGHRGRGLRLRLNILPVHPRHPLGGIV
jgi:hypothetical protein